MRASLLACLVVLASIAAAQTASHSQRDQAVIQRARETLVSTFDGNLPKVTLEFFLKNESEGRAIAWEVNDCGEQAGAPAADRGRDFPMCVQATVGVRDRREVVVMVAVGTFGKGLAGAPKLYSVTLSDQNGVAHAVRLIDLPAKIHRFQGPKLHRDLPPGVSAHTLN